MDGSEKYGGANTSSPAVQTLVLAEWTSATVTNTLNISAGLSSTGNAALLTNTVITKTLAANYARLIGGFRFASNLGSTAGVQFLDVATNQTGISINNTGTISLKSGRYDTGTV